MGETTRTTVTTSTTRTSGGTTTITVDSGYLIPHGLLKIIEIILCIIILSLIASVVGSNHAALNFPLVISIIWFISTLIILIMFMCGLTGAFCGKQAWCLIDTINNAIAVLFFFIGFIILCVYCSYRIRGYTYIINELLTAAILSLVNMILYILSLYFAKRAGITPTITVNA